MAISVATVALIATGVASIATAAATTKNKPVQSSAPKKRRTKDDYYGTSFSSNAAPIQPIQPVQPVQPVYPVYPVGAIKPIAPILPSTNITHYNNPLYNYQNDPYRVNSLADVLLNKKGKDLVLEDLGMTWATHIPVLQELIVGVEHIRENYVQPISEGKFGEAALNALWASGETLDIIANPIKGLFIEGPSGFVHGLGLGEGGRTQYDFDAEFGDGFLANTGEFIISMGAEIASDPLNWASFGTKELVEAGMEKFAKRLTRYTDVPQNKLQRVLAREYLEKGKLDDTTMYALIKNNVGPKTKALIIEQATNVSTNKLLKAVQKLHFTIDKVDKALLYATPIGWTLTGAKYGIKTIPELIKNKTYRNLKRYFTKEVADVILKDPDNFLKTDIKVQAIDQELERTANLCDIEINVRGGREAAQEVYYRLARSKKEVTLLDFLKELKAKDLIDETRFNNYLDDPNFEVYFEQVVEKGAQMQALSDFITDTSFLKKQIDTLKKTSPNNLILVERISEYINPLVGVKSTNNLYDTITNLNDQLKILRTRKQNLKGLNALEEAIILNAQISKLTSIKAELQAVIAEADIDLDLIRDLHNLKKPLRKYTNNPKQLAIDLENSKTSIETVETTIKQEEGALDETIKLLKKERDKAIKALRKETKDSVIEDIAPTPTTPIKVEDKIIPIVRVSYDDPTYIKRSNVIIKDGKKIQTVEYYKKPDDWLNKKPISIITEDGSTKVINYDKDPGAWLEQKVFNSKAVKTETFIDNVKIDQDSVTLTKTDLNKMSTKDVEERIKEVKERWNPAIKLLEDIKKGIRTLDDSKIKGTLISESDNLTILDSYPGLKDAIQNLQNNRAVLHTLQEHKKTLDRVKKFLNQPTKVKVNKITNKAAIKYTNSAAELLKAMQDNTDLIHLATKADVDSLLMDLDDVADKEIKEQVTKKLEELKEDVQADVQEYLEFIENKYNKSFAGEQDLIPDFDIGTTGFGDLDVAQAKIDARLYEELTSLKEPKTFADLQYMMTKLTEAGYYYDVDAERMAILSMILPKEDAYILKMAQAYANLKIIAEYNASPETQMFLHDLAFDENDTTAGMLLNELEHIIYDNNLSITGHEISEIKKVAKAHMAFSQLVDELSTLTDTEARNAFIDLFSAYGYRDPEVFINDFFTDGELDFNKLKTKLEDHMNVHTHVYKRTNKGLAETFGIAYDETKLHDAQYDLQLTRANHEELIKRGAMPAPKDGEVFTHFDIETTGYDINSPNVDQIVQIAATKSVWQDGHFVEIDNLTSYAKLNKDYANIGLNKELIIKDGADNSKAIYTPEFVDAVYSSKESEEEIINKFLEFSEGTLVGHNSDKFDLPRITARYEYYTGRVLDPKAFKTQDTLRGADKLFGFREIKDDVIKTIQDNLKNYLDITRPLNLSNTIQLVDKRTIDKLFDITRDLTTITKNMRTPSNLSKHVNKDIFMQSIESLLGTTRFSTEYVPAKADEYIHAIMTLDPSSKEALIPQLREILSEIKNTNRNLGEYVITKDKLNYYAQHGLVSKLDIDGNPVLSLDAFVLCNGVEIGTENGAPQLVAANHFVFSNVTTKKIKAEPTDYKSWDIRIREKIQNDYNIPLEQRERIVKCIDDISDINTDPVTKIKALDELAAQDIPYAQAMRIRAVEDLRATNAVDPYNLSNKVQTAVDKVHAEEDQFLKQSKEYGDALTKLDDEVYKTANQNIAINNTISVLELEPEQLAIYMSQNGNMLLVGDVTNARYAHLLDKVKASEAYFNQLGFEFRTEGDIFAIIPRADATEQIREFTNLHKDTKITLNNYAIGIEDEVLDEVIRQGNEIHKQFHTLNGSEMLTDTSTTASNLLYADNFYANVRRTHPDLFKNSALNLDGDNTLLADYFGNKTIRRTNTMLGSIQGRRMIDPYYQNPLNQNMTFLENTIKRVDSKSKYLQLVFNNDLSINGTMYKDLTDDELLKMFDAGRRDNTMLILVEGKNGEPVVKTINPTNKAQLQLARDFDAVIMPKHEANKIRQVINHSEFNTKFNTPILQFMYKYVVGFYKGLYLSSLGPIVRNFNDIVIKNNVGEDIADAPHNFKMFMDAAKDWKLYSTDMDNIIKRYGSFNAETVDAYFSLKENAARRKLFDSVHVYATSNASAGLADAQQKLILNYNKAHKLNLFDNLVYEKNPMLNFNKNIEHAGRLANYRRGLELGLTESDALARTVRTHFDYGMKTKTQMLVEFFIPFVTFPLYNLQYWVDAAFESPWLIEALIDASRISLDVEEHTQFTLDKSTYLQSQILNGNIRIGDMVLKLNPSLYDAVNLVTQPNEQLEQRILSPIKFGVKTLMQNDVSENDTKTPNILDELGLYPITRAAKVIKQGVDTLIGGEDPINSLADIAPSVAKEYTQNYGARIGENFVTNRLYTTTGSIYTTRQSKTGKEVRRTFYPKSKTAGRSYKRIPGTKAYYSSSYNYYNSWKAKRARLNATPASPESLGYAFKDLYYKLGANPKILKAYNIKQRNMYRTK